MDSVGLINFLRLIDVMQFSIEVLFNQLIQVLSDLIKVYELSVLLNIGVSIVLFVRSDGSYRLERLTLLRVHNDDIGEYVGEFLGVEDL
jgi:hypothetical protein